MSESKIYNIDLPCYVIQSLSQIMTKCKVTLPQAIEVSVNGHLLAEEKLGKMDAALEKAYKDRDQNETDIRSYLHKKCKIDLPAIETIRGKLDHEKNRPE